ncbi:Chitin synthase regulatory factor 4 [Wickerhamiella sorbophila]|uniref:Chitin synthase regulatory factor 4 n=1 Tax=Wickerhamiella sorbophila TaxID=45607 RepID=A0A2T0FLC9_9ASCO|nr:Chitin synthase regulatory factor 4 [Wickerhamiella sorbophila]PRT55780.1 Chitin synthase regulatory factor 4 [Wickerhamiella sorbophila]
MDPFTVSGRFCFPDHIFPAVDEKYKRIVPTLPTTRANDLETEFQQIIAEGDAYPSEKLMLWVQRVLKLADLFGLGSPRAIAHAKHVLEVLQDSSSPYTGLACYFLGCYYQVRALGYEVDKEKSRILLRKAIKLHYSRAWYRIASNAESRGDTAKALSRYKQGAALDDAACLYRLAIAYFFGQFNLEKDISKGFAMLDMAAQRSDSDYPQPAFLLGKLCLGETELIPDLPATPPGYTDKARGIDLIRKAAFLDFSPALMRLADAYQGEIEFNSAVTLRFLHISTRQERYLAYTHRPSVLHGAPETLLVKWLLCGFQGVFSANEEWAFNFAKIAANLGSGTALFAMGYFYEVGIVASINWDTAQMYYRQSAAAGCLAAKERLKKADSDSVSREPSLRRQLTRVDHERTLSKYRARMGQNNQNQPSMMAINSLDSDNNSPEPTPEPMPLPASTWLDDSPVLAPTPQSPPKLPYPDEEEKSRRRSFFNAAKNMLSSLPYPRSPDRKSRTSSPTRSRSPSRSPPLRLSSQSPAYPLSNSSSPNKLGSAPSLPYPDDGPAPAAPPYPESPPPLPPLSTPVSGRVFTPVSARVSTPESARISTPESARTSAPLPPASAPIPVPAPMANAMNTPRVPSRQQAVRRKPVARAVSGPAPQMAPHETHHARSQTISADIHTELRDWTPSPTRSSPPPRSPTKSPARSVDSTASSSPSKSSSSSALTGPPVRSHRKYGSVAVPSSSPPRPERRFVSSPVTRRPGVAYSFEEMGVPVIAGDDSGKCIIS